MSRPKKMSRKQRLIYFKEYFTDRDEEFLAIDDDDSLRALTREAAERLRLIAEGAEITVAREDAVEAFCDFLREKSPYFLARNPPEELS